MPDHDDLTFELARIAQGKAIRRRRAKPRSAPTPQPETAQGSPTQRIGFEAEHRACEFLTQRGLQVVDKNLRCKAGEIDIVAIDPDQSLLIFVEVKLRTGQDFGGPAASVNRDKQDKLRRAALFFLPRLARTCFGGNEPACRFDVITVDKAGLTWIRNAFDT
ncbi:YraN family protein [Pusillimonas sp. T2]|uniref:YraN family protein n=1 Tax=Pusillimonas sp. T2 TaxID=1548123 RepID=UPI000B9C886D|nr:YraN family protein [Pusillimonas sp. T2]OXR50833.1 YraN family protein [Pusillimonas sp. T2]